LYFFFRRTYLSFEATAPSHISFRVDGIAEKTRRSFLQHCLTAWRKVKLSEEHEAEPDLSDTSALEPSGFRCAVCSERYSDRVRLFSHLSARHALSGSAIDANIIEEVE